MLNQEGTISFISELLGAMDQFIADYEARQGPLNNDLERGLVLSFILGIMRCELETIWDCLAKAPIFGDLHPRLVFEECLNKELSQNAARVALIEQELRKRGWLVGAPR